MTPEETQVIVDNVIKYAFDNAPNKQGFINMNKLLLSHIEYIVKRRPVVGIRDVVNAAKLNSQIEEVSAL